MSKKNNSEIKQIETQSSYNYHYNNYEDDEERANRISKTINVQEWVRTLWSQMVGFRRQLFYYNIEIIEYYLYGELNKEPTHNLRQYLCMAYDVRNQSGYTVNTNYFPHRKTDSVVEHVASQGTSNFASAMMPRGMHSFNVVIQNKSLERDSPMTDWYKDEYKNKSRILTESFQEFLTDNADKILCTVNQMIKDYLIFGSCASVLEFDFIQNNFRLKHIPFRNCYFFSNVEDENFFFGYEEKLTTADYKIKYGDMRPDITSQIVTHLYVPWVWYRLHIKELTEEHIYIQETIEESKKTDPNIEKHTLVYLVFDSTGYLKPPRSIDRRVDNHVVITARNNERSDSAYQVYGKGAAIQAVTSIRDANFFRGIINSAAACTVEPPVILSPGQILNPDYLKRPGTLLAYPGAVNILQSQTITGMPVANTPAQILTQTASQQIQVASEAYRQAIEQIESAFNSQIFTMSDLPNRTATEIIQRNESNMRQFRGTVGPLYVQGLNLLLQRLLLFHIRRDSEIQIVEGDDVKIKNYTFEDEQKEQIEIQKLTQFMQIRQSMDTPFSERESEYVEKTLAKLFME